MKQRCKRATLLDQRNYQHEVDFKVLHSGYEINNPFGDIYTVITQNNRWDNAIEGLQPIFVKNDELIYDYEEENLFDGGNEYRFFDSKSMRYFSERIKNITFENDTNKIILYTDKKNAMNIVSTILLIYGKILTVKDSYKYKKVRTMEQRLIMH